MTFKQSYTVLVLFSLLLLSLSGCKDEETENVQDYCNITNFSIGSLKRTVVKRTGHGTVVESVSTIYTTGWKFVVDQINNNIYNRDSLPTGCARRTLLDITYRGKTLYYRNVDASNDEPWTVYVSSDSVTIPEKGLDFRVEGNGGISRTYRVQLNVHKQEAADWQWSNRTEGLDMDAWNNARLVTLGNTVLLYGTPDGVHWELWQNQGDGAWRKLTVSGLPSEADISGIVAGKKLYVSDDDGKVWTSDDGAQWTEHGLTDATRLVGVSDNRLYAVRDGNLYSGALSGDTEWTEEMLDGQPSRMTDFDDLDSVRCLFFHRENSLKRMLIVGTLNNPTSSDLTAPEWGKMWTADGDELTRAWTYYTPAWQNLYELPAQWHQAVVLTNDNLVAFGGTRPQKDNITPLNLIYVSVDCGVTWHTNELFYLPDELWGKNCSWLNAASDADGFVWLVARVFVDDGDEETYVMKGWQNSLSFAE